MKLKRIYLIGGYGFVGSAYKRLFDKLGLDCHIITRDNAEEYKGTSCDILINANGNSKKFMARRDPVWEFEASVSSVVQSTEWYKANKFVLLSTGDVYSGPFNPEKTSEDSVIPLADVSRYGLHKRMAESYIEATKSDFLIMRMGGFVGPGLKKNAIYDMIKGDPVWLAPESKLQFIHTDSAARIVWSLIEKGVSNEIVNLGASGMVELREVYKIIGSKSEFKADATEISYELSTKKLAFLYEDELPTSRDEVLSFLSNNL